MSVKIIIERKFKEPPVQGHFRILERIRMTGMEQEGYITGETLVNYHDSREVLVLSTWSSLDDWKSWVNSPNRSRLENQLVPYLEEPAKVTSFMLGADALKEAFERFVHDTEVSSTLGGT
jgi:heme-degrading monooxygenase HmoA